MTLSGKRLLTLLLMVALWLPAHSENAPGSAPLAELWFQTSAEYRAICHQTYNMAWHQFQDWRPLMVRGEDGRARLAGSDKPVAIILDLDETVIDNCGFQAFQYKTGTPYNPRIWSSWVKYQAQHKEAGRTVPGAVEFLSKVESLGITVLFVSNRSVGDEPSTTRVLERAGINVENLESRLLLHLPKDQERDRARKVAKATGIKLDSEAGRALLVGEGSKEARRQQFREHYDVVAYFGDVLGDFEPFVQMADDTRRLFEQRQEAADRNKARWGSTWFVLPNPIYGSWERAVPKAQRADAINDYGFSQYIER